MADFALVANIFKLACDIITDTPELETNGYRLITNSGPYQDSKHLHFHLVSGPKFRPGNE